MASDRAETMSAGRSFQTLGAKARSPIVRKVVCDAQAASESSPIAVVSASRPCLPTVGFSPRSSVQSGCDSGTQELSNETWCVQGRAASASRAEVVKCGRIYDHYTLILQLHWALTADDPSDA